MIFLTINLNKGKKKNELKMNQLDFSAIILKIFKELKIWPTSCMSTSCLKFGPLSLYFVIYALIKKNGSS